MSLKIGIIAHLKHVLREPFAGGLEMQTLFLARGLESRGHTVTVFGAGDGDPQLGVEVIAQDADEERSADQFSVTHEAYLRLMLRLRKADFDIVHNNSLHYLPVAMANQLSVPMITTLHTPPFWELEGSIRFNRFSNSRFTAVSQSLGKAWLPITGSDCVVPNGIDLKKFAFRSQSSATPYVIWFGRIVPEKGLHLAILAARLSGLPLHIAGPISDVHYYRNEIQPLLDDKIVYLGHLDHGELIRSIAGAICFLCTPMWEEPYGLVVAESLACGTPVVAFARGALPALLDSKSGILVAPDDYRALANAVIDVQRLDRGDCRRRAEIIGDGNNMIDAYEALYIKLIVENREQPQVIPAASLCLEHVTGSNDLRSRYENEIQCITPETRDADNMILT